MKSNKKLTIILLSVVIIIWGIIIYKIIFEHKSFNNDSNLKKTVKRESTEIKRDDYKLIANYRDPFLWKIKSNQTQQKKREKEKKKDRLTSLRRRSNASRVSWPEIIYGGYIENKGSNFSIIVNIKNKSYIAVEGNVIEGVEIKEFYKDSILVVYNDEKKIIRVER